MARRPAKEKDPVSVAMILMRRQMGITQEKLAGRLHVALPTVGRWESYDPPRGIILERLANFAESEGLPVAADFRYALEKENNRELPTWFRMESEKEIKRVKATLLISRDPKFTELGPKLDRLMRPVFAAPEFQMNEDPGVRKIEAEIKAAGVPESSITRLLRKEREYAKAYAAQLECDQEQTDSMAIPTPDTAVPSPPAKRRAKKKRAKTLARP